ncbi:hypothetical protein QOT17_019786 [Balamuthia mandrillaris]
MQRQGMIINLTHKAAPLGQRSATACCSVWRTTEERGGLHSHLLLTPRRRGLANPTARHSSPNGLWKWSEPRLCSTSKPNVLPLLSFTAQRWSLSSPSSRRYSTSTTTEIVSTQKDPFPVEDVSEERKQWILDNLLHIAHTEFFFDEDERFEVLGMYKQYQGQNECVYVEAKIVHNAEYIGTPCILLIFDYGPIHDTGETTEGQGEQNDVQPITEQADALRNQLVEKLLQAKHSLRDRSEMTPNQKAQHEAEVDQMISQLLTSYDQETGKSIPEGGGGGDLFSILSQKSANEGRKPEYKEKERERRAKGVPLPLCMFGFGPHSKRFQVMTFCNEPVPLGRIRQIPGELPARYYVWKEGEFQITTNYDWI